jgi:hypothetical protein
MVDCKLAQARLAQQNNSGTFPSSTAFESENSTVDDPQKALAKPVAPGVYGDYDVPVLIAGPPTNYSSKRVA